MDETNRSSAKRQIARLLGSSFIPIYVISEEDTLVFANQALGQLVGRSPESLLGLLCSSPIPEDGNPNAQLSAFFSLPTHWSRQFLKLQPEFGPIPRFNESYTPSTNVPIDSQWMRCLIPLEEKTGCVLCVLCPTPHSELNELIDEQSSITHKIMRENRSRFVHLDTMWYLQGKSAGIRRALEQVQIAIVNHLPLTVFGQKGSGRSWLAQSIESRRKGRNTSERKFTIGDSLIRIDCSLMDVELLQSMLEVIDESKMSSKGEPTVLLDSLEGLPQECISQLATFLKHHESTVCIGTCDPNLVQALSMSDLRWKDVLSRISVIRVDLPRLIDRLEDIPTLVSAWFSDQRNPAREISGSFVEALTAYSWPEDIEEFADALSHATKNASGDVLTDKDLPVNIRTCVSHIEQSHVDETVDLDSILDDVEKTMIMRALERFPQNKTSAAKLLNISRARLLRRLQQWGIQPESGTVDGDDDMPIFNEVE
ncbi:MAG TPA: helix-turn-helix domain-containing protein [Pirellula sp.]|nr:helix-turn-helix domain-containing protein [Pirellula sp.]